MFKPIDSRRIHEIITDQIKDALFAGRLRPGDKLPSERELVEQFHVSRVTVREALRALENQGLLIIRQGADGGAFVAEAGSGVVTESLSNMLRLEKVAIADLTEARLILEPEAARLASIRATGRDIRRLEENLEKARASGRRLLDKRMINLEFHRYMAKISRNRVVVFMINSVIDVMIENISRSFLEATSIEGVMEYHKQIIESIRNRDPDRCFEIMRKHIIEIQKALENSREELAGVES